MFKLLLDGETARRAVSLLYTATQTNAYHNFILEHLHGLCFVVERYGEAIIVPVTPVTDSDPYEALQITLPYSFLSALRGATLSNVARKVIHSENESGLCDVSITCNPGSIGLCTAKIQLIYTKPLEQEQEQEKEYVKYTSMFDCAWSNLYRNMKNSLPLVTKLTLPIEKLRAAFAKGKKFFQNRIMCKMIFDPEEGLIFRDLVTDINRKDAFLIEFRELQCIMFSLRPYESEDITLEVYKRNKDYHLVASFNPRWEKNQQPVVFVHCLNKIAG